MLKFYYKPITNNANYGGTRSKSSIKYIVIHWTANTSKTADAMNHYKYFQYNRVGASAHYFVDEEKIVQIVGDSRIAYAVGGNQGYGVALNGATNANSLSVEMCVNNGYSAKLLFNTIELVKELKRQFPNAIVCRHWDATRKDCPHGFTGNNNARWNKFLEDIKKPRRLILDLSKDSVAKEVKSMSENKEKIVMYLHEGDKDTAVLLAKLLNIKCYKDDGKLGDLSKYQVLYVSNLGKDRKETAKIAFNKWL